MKAATDLLSSSRIMSRARIADFAELIKARLTLLVLLTTFVGFYLGSPESLNWTGLFHALAGTALLASGAAALNQLWERHRDARMERTRARPLPAGRIEPAAALGFGVFCSVAGLTWLAIWSTLLSVVVGAATLGLYLFVYTPLKTRTSWNTLIGAVPGALPPVIGWVAASGEMAGAAWLLFALQFFWQIPHFLAIAWLYRTDYARGGFVMLPVVDPSGRLTGWHSVAAAAALLVAAALAVPLGVTGWICGAIVVMATAAYLTSSVRFCRSLAERDARWLFFGSIIYLPVLLGLLVLDRMT